MAVAIVPRPSCTCRVQGATAMPRPGESAASALAWRFGLSGAWGGWAEREVRVDQAASPEVGAQRESALAVETQSGIL